MYSAHGVIFRPLFYFVAHQGLSPKLIQAGHYTILSAMICCMADVVETASAAHKSTESSLYLFQQKCPPILGLTPVLIGPYPLSKKHKMWLVCVACMSSYFAMLLWDAVSLSFSI